MIVVKDIYNDLRKYKFHPDSGYIEYRENLLGLISKAKLDWDLEWNFRVRATHLLLNHDGMCLLEEDANAELENSSNILGLTIVETVDESVRLAHIL